MKDQDAKYCLKFDLPEKDKTKEMMTSAEFMEAMSNVVIGFEELNQSLMTGISSEITVMSYIEDIENGSIKIWLKDNVAPIVKKISERDIEEFCNNPVFPVLKLGRKLFLEWVGEDLPNDEKEAKLSYAFDPVFEHPNAKLINSDFFQKEKWNKDATKKSASKIINTTNKMPKVFFIDNNNDSLEIKGEYEYHETLTSYNDEDLDLEIIIAPIIVYSPVYDMSVKKWKFKLYDKIQSIDVSSCEIPEMVLKRRGAHVHDTFRVELEIIKKKTKSGFRFEYKVLKVIECLWAPV